MGFSFAVPWYSDDVQFYADGRIQADTVLQAMYDAVFVAASESGVL
jgi:hypothetical protein